MTARTIRSAALDPTSNMLQVAKVRVSGRELDGAYIETFERGLGMVPDELTFTIRHPEDMEYLTLRVENFALNIIGNPSATYGPTAPFSRERPCEVSLVIAGVTLWVGFIVDRTQDVDSDCITYTAHDIRCLMRETVAGSLVYMKTDPAAELPTIKYTHRRNIFNPESRPNRAGEGIAFAPRALDESICTYWALDDAIEYLVLMRDMQATAYGIARDDANAKAIRFSMDLVNLVDVNGITEGMRDWSLVWDAPDAGTLRDNLRGGLDDWNPDGLTYHAALEHVCNLHGVTLATGPGGVLKAVPMSSDVPSYIESEPVDLEQWGPVGFRVKDDWKDAYAVAANIPLPNAVEGTDLLSAAWSTDQLARFNSTYRGAYGNLGYLNLAAFRKACEAEWMVMAAYKVPLEYPFLDELAQLDPITGEPLRTFQLWVKDPDSGQFVPLAIDRAGLVIDTLRHMILLPGLRYGLDNLTYDDATQTFTPLDLKMTFAVEHWQGQVEKSVVKAMRGDEGIDLGAQSLSGGPDGTIEVSAPVQKQFKFFRDFMPPIALYSLSTLRARRTGTSDGATLEPVLAPSLYKANKDKTTFQSSPAQENEVTLDINDENQLAAARALYAHRPGFIVRGRLQIANLALCCGTLVKRTVMLRGGVTKDIKFVVGQVRHTYPGTEQNNGLPVDLPTGTEVESVGT